jgi:transposase
VSAWPVAASAVDDSVIVDVGAGQLLDVVEGRTAIGPLVWLVEQPQQWRDRIEWATLDLSDPYRKVFDTMLPDAVQVADPFHLVKVRHEALCYPVGCKDPPVVCRSRS